MIAVFARKCGAALASASILLSACSPNGAQPAVRLETTEEYRDIGNALESGQSHLYNEFDFNFVAGVLSELLECPLPELAREDRVELAMVMTVGALSVHSPGPTSFEEALQRSPTKATAWAAGLQTARTLNCAEPSATALAQNILAVDRSNRSDGQGGDAQFVTSCTPHHGRSACICIGLMSRSTHPNVFQARYTRQYMSTITNSMGFSALGILGVCGITRY